jgi:transcriptional antiterminator RfaH
VPVFTGKEPGTKAGDAAHERIDWSTAMNPLTEAQWFAIQARVSGEKIAETSLAQLGFETLLPLLARKAAGWRARKNPTKALFPGYLFARFFAVTDLRAAMYARGVICVVSAGDRPLTLEEPIIEGLRARMDAAGRVTLDRQPFTPGEAVCIAAGPLEGWRGVFDHALTDGQRLVILLETLHQGRLAVRADWVERCAAA